MIQQFIYLIYVNVMGLISFYLMYLALYSIRYAFCEVLSIIS
jgi:hypothetical protein